MQTCYLAVDIGASSGRHIIGTVEHGVMALHEVYRFENRLIEKHGHLCWDMEGLVQNVIEGLKAAHDAGYTPTTVGIDTWAVDFLLLDADGTPIGDPVAYRDGRTAAMREELEPILPFTKLYARTGIQYQSFNMQAALRQLNVTLHYADREKDHLLTLAFEPAIIKETEEHGKKTVLLLEDRDEMVWLISDLLADEFVVCPVKSVQLAFEEIRRSAPALLLVDMLMYAKAESDFLEYVNKNRTQLSKTAFIPMLSWKVSSSIQRELIMWADSYIVLPYDIIFLKEAVNKAIYGTREAKQIYMEELGDWAGRIVCTTEEQADFIRKLLQVIEQNLDQEELGSTLIADRMAMSPRQFYRKFKEISNAAPSDLIKSYRMEKAARLLQNEELSIQDVIAEVGISSRSYFYKEFTRRFGMTPKDYREQLR